MGNLNRDKGVHQGTKGMAEYGNLSEYGRMGGSHTVPIDSDWAPENSKKKKETK